MLGTIFIVLPKKFIVLFWEIEYNISDTYFNKPGTIGSSLKYDIGTSTASRVQIDYSSESQMN